MTKYITLVLAGALLSLSLTTCKKYEDGPTVSMRFKSTRIANDWVFDSLVVDGVNYTSEMDYLETGVYVLFSKGGDFKVVVPNLLDTLVGGDSTMNIDTTIIYDTSNNPIDTIYDTSFVASNDTVYEVTLQSKFSDTGVWIFEQGSKKQYITIQRDNPNYDVDFYIKELKEHRFVYTYDEIHPDHIQGNYYVELKPIHDYLQEKIRGEN